MFALSGSLNNTSRGGSKIAREVLRSSAIVFARFGVRQRASIGLARSCICADEERACVCDPEASFCDQDPVAPTLARTNLITSKRRSGFQKEARRVECAARAQFATADNDVTDVAKDLATLLARSGPTGTSPGGPSAPSAPAGPCSPGGPSSSPDCPSVSSIAAGNHCRSRPTRALYGPCASVSRRRESASAFGERGVRKTRPTTDETSTNAPLRSVFRRQPGKEKRIQRA